VLYPEGGVTQREDYRPGRPLPGLGVLAAELGVPVLPVAQWGAQYVVGRGWLTWRAWPPQRAEVVVEAMPLVPPPEGSGVLAARRFTAAVLDAVAARVEELRCSPTSSDT
jgi:1-acyl-sn-glycerol-3-phosphate acyltransferase